MSDKCAKCGTAVVWKDWGGTDRILMEAGDPGMIHGSERCDHARVLRDLSAAREAIRPVDMSYKCPKCGGAERRPEAGFLHRLFDCGSIQATSGYTRESAQCLRRQLDAEKAKVKRLREASRKLRLCFPDVMPKGELQAEFTIPRYIIEELAAALAETETTT